MNPHNHIIAIDRSGTETRKWRCKMCGEDGTCDDLVGPKQKNDCGYTYPPCESCGQTPECAADCAGIAAALSSPKVRVIW